MMRSMQLQVALVTAAAAVLAGGASTGNGSVMRPTGNSATFHDPVGEDSLAPDMTAVTVSNDDAGQLTFRVKIANRPRLTGHMNIRVELDTDRNPNNGCGSACDGSDMILDLVPGSVAVGRWHGSKWDFSGRSPASLGYSYVGGTATIKVKASDLELTRFNFWVLSDANSRDPKSHVDYAPGPGHGTWSYQVKLTASPKCQAGQNARR